MVGKRGMSDRRLLWALSVLGLGTHCVLPDYQLADDATDMGGAGSSQGGMAGAAAGGDAGDGSGAGGTPGDAGAGPGGAGGTGSGGTGSGGTGTGGVVTTDGDPIPKPLLITSWSGEFWKTDVDPTPGGTTANITVDTSPGAELQSWIGWGGTFSERGWASLMGLDQAQREGVMKLLFSKVDGLGLTWGRIPIGASDYAMDRYTLCDAPCNETNIETTFSIDRDLDPDQGLIPYVKAAQAVVEAEKAQYKGISDPVFSGSPWTPPPWMKNNNAYDKGMMRNESAILEAYAKYFALWVQEYEEQGIPIDHVYPQNEPGWAQSYPSCAWGPFTDGSTDNSATPPFLGTFVEQNLIPALADAGLATKVWLGTLSNDKWFSNYWGSLTDETVVGGMGLQWETINSIATPIAAGVTVMQSAHRCGNYPWVSGANNGTTSTAVDAESADKDTFWAEYAPNNYNYGVESWELLKQWITAGANGYSAWHMVLDREGIGIDVSRPWPQNALISFEANGDVKITPYYYVFRHLSQYVEPGARRLTVTGGDALAFKNPDGSVVTVVYNSGAATQITLSVGGNMVHFQAPANGWATVNTLPPG